MSFQSIHFTIFLAGLAASGYFLKGRFGARKNVLLLASYYFYMMLDWRFAGVLLWLTLVNYLAGRAIDNATSKRAAGLWLWTCMGASLLTLGCFKYFNFFIDAADSFLRSFGLDPNLPMLEIALPVGISFYTFQAISYTIDVHRGKQKHCSNFRDFALFVGFFATVLSGPITRAGDLLSQLRDPFHFRDVNANEGLVLIVRGLIKKVIFADTLATQLVNPAFADPNLYSSSFLIVALYAYTLQIYMDLSGYTDIARGSAQVLGFRLPENFRQPYLSASLSSFWQRWHISMSSFFRDYLFFGVGGSKHGNVYQNLMVTFVAIGLWHGAGWNFVVYGLIHGAVVCLERRTRLRREALGVSDSAIFSQRWFVGVLLTFHIVVGSRLLFRSADLNSAGQFLGSLFHGHAGSTPLSMLGVLTLVLAAALHLVPPRISDATVTMVSRAPIPLQSGAVIACIFLAGAFGSGEAPFVYFQF